MMAFLWPLFFFGMQFMLMFGVMFNSPRFYAAAAVMFALFIVSTNRTYTNVVRDAHARGDYAVDTPMRRGCTIMAFMGVAAVSLAGILALAVIIG